MLPLLCLPAARHPFARLLLRPSRWAVLGLTWPGRCASQHGKAPLFYAKDDAVLRELGKGQGVVGNSRARRAPRPEISWSEMFGGQ
jgi:hypothetical protein